MRRAISFLTPAALAALLALAGCGESRPIAGQSSDAQCSGCHVSASAAEIGSGAHAAHVRAGTIAGAMGCGECHRVPAALAAPGHMDGKVDVAFSAKAGGPRASWNGEQRSCAVDCHGEATPVWTQVDGSHSRCGACHGIPPGGSHPQAESRSEVCATCHPSTVRPDGKINLAGGAHVNGRVDRGGDAGIACGSCHGIPPGGGHTSSTTCGSCHQGYTATSVNPALHQNGRKDVLSAEAACGSCHGIPPGGGHTSSTTCGSCHQGYTATSINPALHQNGRKDVLSAEAACGSCHGIPPGGGHTSSTTCGSCHQGYTATSVNPALHQNGRKDVLSAEAACGSCHGIPPGGGHTSSTTCGSCHQGYTATSVNPALHQNGTKDVTAQACGSCHAIPPSTGQHREHVEEGISCGRCHEGASASAGGPGHMNGVVNVRAPGWNAGARSCANSCHGTEKWDGGGDDDDD